MNGDGAGYPSAGEVATGGVDRRVTELEARVLELEHFIVDFITDKDHVPEYKGLARVRVEKSRALALERARPIRIGDNPR